MLETNVHFPTDINLLWDSVRKCIDIIEKINQKHPLGGWRKSQNWRNRFKKVKLYLERANRGGGKNKEQRLLRFAQQYLDLGFRLEEKIFASIKEVGSLPVVANINKQASSKKTVGRFGLRQLSHRMIQGDLKVFEGLKTIGFSGSQIYFSV